MAGQNALAAYFGKVASPSALHCTSGHHYSLGLESLEIVHVLERRTEVGDRNTDAFQESFPDNWLVSEDIEPLVHLGGIEVKLHWQSKEESTNLSNLDDVLDKEIGKYYVHPGIGGLEHLPRLWSILAVEREHFQDARMRSVGQSLCPVVDHGETLSHQHPDCKKKRMP